MNKSNKGRPVTLANLTLYAGEVAGYPMEPDCFEFNSVREAAKWLVSTGKVSKVEVAVKGIYAVYEGRLKQYRGYTIAFVPLEVAK